MYSQYIFLSMSAWLPPWWSVSLPSQARDHSCLLTMLAASSPATSQSILHIVTWENITSLLKLSKSLCRWQAPIWSDPCLDLELQLLPHSLVLCSSHTSICSDHWTHQAWSNLRAFAHAVFSAWNPLLPATYCVAGPFLPFRSQFKGHLHTPCPVLMYSWPNPGLPSSFCHLSCIVPITTQLSYFCLFDSLPPRTLLQEGSLVHCSISSP